MPYWAGKRDNDMDIEFDEKMRWMLTRHVRTFSYKNDLAEYKDASGKLFALPENILHPSGELPKAPDHLQLPDSATVLGVKATPTQHGTSHHNSKS
jgi:hypothetical protein